MIVMLRILLSGQRRGSCSLTRPGSPAVSPPWPSTCTRYCTVLHCTAIYCTVLYCTVLYVHKLGLKFGIYEDYGNYTCGGYPGVLGHMQVSAGMGMMNVVTRASNEGSRRFHNYRKGPYYGSGAFTFKTQFRHNYKWASQHGSFENL